MSIRLPVPSSLLRSRAGTTFTLPVMLALAACGPVHPRWHNASGNDIEISYFRQAEVFSTTLRHGAEGMPADFLDFQSVEKIAITDAGRTFRLNGAEIGELHRRCGHGFKCQIEYLEPGHLIVKAS